MESLVYPEGSTDGSGRDQVKLCQCWGGKGCVGSKGEVEQFSGMYPNPGSSWGVCPSPTGNIWSGSSFLEVELSTDL